MEQVHNLEWAVRIIALQDTNHEHNKFYVWDGCVVGATFNAGVCASSVVRYGTTLYSANAHGNNVAVRRDGKWIGRIIAEAERIQRERDELEAAEQERADNERKMNFAPIDF